jgi:hypothetical protein
LTEFLQQVAGLGGASAGGGGMAARPQAAAGTSFLVPGAQLRVLPH